MMLPANIGQETVAILIVYCSTYYISYNSIFAECRCLTYCCLTVRRKHHHEENDKEIQTRVNFVITFCVEVILAWKQPTNTGLSYAFLPWLFGFTSRKYLLLITKTPYQNISRGNFVAVLGKSMSIGTRRVKNKLYLKSDSVNKTTLALTWSEC